MLNKVPSADQPLVFKGNFLPLMKALLVSRVIAKAPLGNANDIRGLRKAKVAFEKKGYENEDLMKLLIITHRLWTPKRMKQFADRIPTVSTASAAPAVSTAAPASPAAAAAAAAPASPVADDLNEERNLIALINCLTP
jgi:hypothetical protein